MKINILKLLIFALVGILTLMHPLSISAAVYQKKTAHNQPTIFEHNTKAKQGFFPKLVQKFIQKRIEKYLKKQSKRNFEQEKPSQTVGLIALILLFTGMIFLLLMSNVGFLIILAALILSIIGMITEDMPTYARRTFWISLVFTLYFLARLFKVF